MPTTYAVRDDEKRKLWVDFYDHNNKEVSRELGEAVYIRDIYRVFETNSILLNLEYEYLGNTQNLLISRGNLKKSELLKYADKGLNITEFNALYMIEFITIQENNHPPKLIHQEIGWDTLKDESGKIKDVFKGYQTIGADSEYRGNYPIKPKGKLTKLRNFIKNHINGTPLALAVALGLSSVLVGFLGNDLQSENLVAHLYGDSTTGKTTAAKLAVSMGSFPSFFTEHSLLNNYDATENALLATLIGNHGFPAAFDEANSKDKKTDFSNFIYRLASGRGKRRLTKEAKQKELETYLTTILSTGEKSLTQSSNQNVGKEIRVLQFGSVPWTKNVTHAELVNSFVQDNYGWPVLYLAKHLLKMGKAETIKRFEKNREIFIKNSRVSDNFTGRLSIKYALMLTAAELANECMDLCLPYEDILEMLLQNEADNAGSRDLSLKAYDYLMQAINKNIKKFSLAISRNEIENCSSNEVWGVKVPQREAKDIDGKKYSMVIYITAQKFMELLNEGKFEDASVVLKKLKKNNLLDYEKGRDTRTRKITMDGTAIKVYGLRVFDEVSDDTGEPEKSPKKLRRHIAG